MSDEAQIVNRIVVQGIDEAKAQVQSLRQMLLEAKAGYEQARRSTNEQGLFQGATKEAGELKRIINEIQLQIKRLNTEISQGNFGTREKALNEELKIRQRIAQQAEQQSARELADQQSLIEQMAKGRERAMSQASSREAQMNAAQVARINSAAEQERASQLSLVEQMARARETSMDRTAARERSMNDAQVARMNSNAERERASQLSLVEQMARARETSMERTAAREQSMNAAQVARINSAAEQEFRAKQEAAAKLFVLGSVGTTGSQMSYARQMSTLSANIEEQYRAFRRGSIGPSKYAKALDKYTKGMSVARAEQDAFTRSIGTHIGALGRMRARIASHASWIMAGGILAGALAVPTKLVDDIIKMDTAMAGVNQVLDHTNTASRAASKGISEQAEQQNMLNSESDKFLTIAAQYGESVTNIIEAGKLWGKIYICSAA